MRGRLISNRAFTYCLLILVTLSIHIWGAVVSEKVEAATFNPSNKSYCRYTMSGVIEIGDLEKLKAISVTGKLFADGDPEIEIVGDKGAAICLDSPGGNFVEGIALSRYFSEKGISTVIDDGSICWSACAIVFMAGRTYGTEEDYVNRKLHIRGSLGFHRPYLALPDTDERTYTGRDVNKSADFLMDAVTFMLSLGNEKGSFDAENRMKPSLIEEMLKRGPDELLLVDSVDRAGRWGIDVFGYSSPVQLTQASLYNACANFIAWSIDQSNNDEFSKGLKLSTAEKLVRPLKGKEKPAISGDYTSYNVTPGKSGYAATWCTVNVYESNEHKHPFVRLCASDGFIGITYSDCYSKDDAYDSWVNPLAIYPPMTKLRDLNPEN